MASFKHSLVLAVVALLATAASSRHLSQGISFSVSSCMLSSVCLLLCSLCEQPCLLAFAGLWLRRHSPWPTCQPEGNSGRRSG